MVSVFFFLRIKGLFCILWHQYVFKLLWQWQPISPEGFHDLKSFSADPVGNDIDKKIAYQILTYFWLMMVSSHNQYVQF